MDVRNLYLERPHKKPLIALGLLTTVTIVFGIHLLQLSTPPPSNVFKAKGIVQFVGLEGGYYGIRSDNGSVYSPVNLPWILQKDDLRVWFKAERTGYNFISGNIAIKLTKITVIFTLGKMRIPADIVGMTICISLMSTESTVLVDRL